MWQSGHIYSFARTGNFAASKRREHVTSMPSQSFVNLGALVVMNLCLAGCGRTEKLPVHADAGGEYAIGHLRDPAQASAAEPLLSYELDRLLRAGRSCTTYDPRKWVLASRTWIGC